MIKGEPTNRGSGPEASSRQTVLTYPVVDRLVIFLGIPAAALLVAALLPPLARWVLGLSTGFPMRPVFRLVGAIDSPREWGRPPGDPLLDAESPAAPRTDGAERP